MPLVTRVVDAQTGHQKITTRAEHVAVVHLLERRLDVADADLLGDERVEVEPALLVEVDQHREVARRAGSRRTSWTSARRRGRRRRSAGCRGSSCPGVGHADQDDGAGQVAGVERLLPGLGPADRVDHDVGAVAAGERLDRLDRVGRPCCSRCGWRPSCVAPSSFRSSMSTAMIVPAPASAEPGDRGRRRRRRSRSRRRSCRGRRCRC